MKRSVLTTIAVALLCVTAGCAGLVGEETPANSPDAADGGAGDTPAAQGMSGAADEAVLTDDDALGDAQPAFEAPNVQAGGSYENYTALYDATIDSVVEVGVQTSEGQGTGSGFVYDEAGYVVTNQHVVSSAEEVAVRFSDGTRQTGEVVGTDVYTDLAVIEVPSIPNGTEALPLAEAAPEPGQPVAAIGSPFGLQGSITHGIVSGTNRSMPVAQGFSIPDTVQTDAPINPGNSGGPLVSMSGSVVGVNRATAGDNVGFAISADVVAEVVPGLVRNGSYDHSYLGIRTGELTPAAAQIEGLNVSEGLVVAEVLPGGPSADQLEPATLRQGPDGEATYTGGDIIVGIGGQSIETQHELARYLLFETHPGETVQVTVLRGDERVTVPIELGQRPDPTQQGGF